MTARNLPVVFDVNVLVTALKSSDHTFRVPKSWPVVPPVSTNPGADCIGVINDGGGFALWLSQHIIDNTVRVLEEVFGIAKTTADDYALLLQDFADASGGGVVDPDPKVSDCKDWEDNRILDLAAEVEALAIVSNDTDLLSMNPWRNRVIMTPAKFAAMVDGQRRAAQRHHKRRR